MKRLIFLSLLSTLLITAQAQHTYLLQEPAATPVSVKPLPIPAFSPQGEKITANSLYLMRNGVPFIPVMGEFHYCRYPHTQWKEQLLKMKAGGITVVSTYVFWNIHEPTEGHFVWSGDYDLRRFVEMCQELGLHVIVRIGPFDHGEIRNGGLPDWLYTKPVDVRSNDPLYLDYTRKFFTEIAKQLSGLYIKDGGPIVGIQIENEHQHAAASWALSYMGKSEYTSVSYDMALAHLQITKDERKNKMARLGDEHMLTLLKMAQQAGICVPIYTATGWGNAATLGDHGLPVMAAYPYATWTDITKTSPFCLFTDLRKTPDYSPVRFNPQDFPSIYAEMGCGIQMGYDRRPIVHPQGVATVLLRSLGSGSNGIGYYMYQGGATPKMHGGTGYYSEGEGFLPRISYDFQAPLAENGQERESYRRLRVLHHFINAFGPTLAPMQTVLPKDNDLITADDHDRLRYAARMKDGSGFLFLINYQDHDTLRHDINGIRFQLKLRQENLQIPYSGSLTLPKNTNIIMPFNLQMGKVLMKYATAQLLTMIKDRNGDHYFFFVPDGMKAEYFFDAATVKGGFRFNPVAGLKSTFTVLGKDGKRVSVTTLTEQQALDAAMVDGHLLITSATVLPGQTGGATLLSVGKPFFDYVLYPSSKGLRQQTIKVEEVKPKFELKTYGGPQLMALHLCNTTMQPQVHEYFLNIDYTANVAMAFLNNGLIDDDFWHATTWTIGLRRFMPLLKTEDMIFRLRPLQQGHPCLKSLPRHLWPTFGASGKICEVKHLDVVPEYQVHIAW